ncbi:MAG: hypothetical protein EOP48_12965 [Sphingobacteriales bacterium]|nr:MAG: hypothetical protein EOP48_12965 [Sphingobacteriales bacterium]
MKQIIAFLLLAIASSSTFAQQTSKYPLIGDFKGLYKFDRCCQYDIDLQRQSAISSCEAIVSFTVDKNSTGSLSFFLMSKLKFKILHCYAVEKEYQFDLESESGKVILGILKLNSRNAVESFWLFIDKDEAIVTSYR